MIDKETVTRVKNKLRKRSSDNVLTISLTGMCESCQEQCMSRGGGTELNDGRCMCNDGTILECMIEE